jgi:hypothetical protein
MQQKSFMALQMDTHKKQRERKGMDWGFGVSHYVIMLYQAQMSYKNKFSYFDTSEVQCQGRSP